MFKCVPACVDMATFFHNHLADWRRPRNATTQAGWVRVVSLVQSQGSK